VDKQRPSSLEWRKSSYSGSDGGCIEVAGDRPGFIAIRDSKDVHGPKLAFVVDEWKRFISHLRPDSASSAVNRLRLRK